MDYDKKDPRMFDEASAQKQMADALVETNRNQRYR